MNPAAFEGSPPMTPAASEGSSQTRGDRPRRRVLIRLPNWIGAAVMAAPAVLALGEARPQWDWLLLGGPRSLPLFAGLGPPFVPLPQLPPRHSRPRSFLEAVVRIRRAGPEAALVLPPSFSSAWMISLAGVPIRFGWPGDGRGGLLTARGAEPTRTRPLREQYAELGEAFLELLGESAPISPEMRRLPLLAEEIGAAASDNARLGLDPARTIALAPGASYGPTKRWPEDRFLALGKILRSEGWSLLWFGGGEESRLCLRLAEATSEGGPSSAPGVSVSQAGTMSLRRSLALLAGLRAMISNDSGAMHLAQAAGCPVVGIFGSTSPEWTGPSGPRQAVVHHRLACSPCFARSCPTAIECLDAVTVEEVRLALAEVLRRDASLRRTPAVFLDRDGTVLDLVPYLRTVEETRLAPGAARGLRRLQEAGYALVVVTNQSAIARGLLDEEGLRRIHERMIDLLREEGIVLRGLESCPHHPDFGEPCACRKPEPGMILRAAHRFDLDLDRSFTIGDSVSDLQAGRAARTRTILVRGGYGRETERSLPPDGSPADAVCDDLEAAAERILAASVDSL